MFGGGTVAYESFDIDLREGSAREDAFVHVMLRSRVEHKHDKKAWRTGRVAVELEQRCADGVVRASGVNMESDRFAVEFAPECWFILPTEYVRGIAALAEQHGEIDPYQDDGPGYAWIGDGHNHRNALVPIEWFVRRLRELGGPTQ